MFIAIILWFLLYNRSSAIFNYYEMIGLNVPPIGRVKAAPLLIVQRGVEFEPAQPIGYADGKYQFDDDSEDVYYACGLHILYSIYIKLEKERRDLFCGREPEGNLTRIEDDEKYTFNYGYRIKGFTFGTSTHFVSMITLHGTTYAATYKFRGPYLFDTVNRSALKADTLKYQFTIVETPYVHFPDDAWNHRNRWNFVKAKLIPADNFVTLPERQITAQYKNLIPIWNIMQQKWLNIDHFIRKVSYVIGELTIFIEQASLLTVQNSPISTISLRILEEDEKIPVPRYYIKAVIHEPSETAIIIVFDMNIEKDSEKLCDRDISQENGWFMTNLDDTGAIYACEFNKDMLPAWEAELPETYGILNLNKLQYEVTKKGEILKYDQNVVEEILNKFY